MRNNSSEVFFFAYILLTKNVQVFARGLAPRQYYKDGVQSIWQYEIGGVIY